MSDDLLEMQMRRTACVRVRAHVQKGSDGGTDAVQLCLGCLVLLAWGREEEIYSHHLALQKATAAAAHRKSNYGGN